MVAWNNHLTVMARQVSMQQHMTMNHPFKARKITQIMQLNVTITIFDWMEGGALRIERVREHITARQRSAHTRHKTVPNLRKHRISHFPSISITSERSVVSLVRFLKFY